ncbi:tetratricopeptide repeat protein [Tateyamaria sp.]|uniref:tetratricopeptide repeat protein n=1 Tax=Tateyamaria sp. TaxID=1929288 RepID=UPI0032A08686
MKTVFERLVKPNDTLALTLLYPERSENIVATLVELLEDGLLVKVHGDVRFLAYDIVKDIRTVKDKNEADLHIDTHVNNKTRQPLEPTEKNGSVDWEEDPALPVEETTPTGNEPDPTILRDKKMSRKIYTAQLSSKFKDEVDNFVYPKFIGQTLTVSALSRKIISAHDKVSYALKSNDHNRLSEIHISSLVHDALRQHDPKINLAVAQIARQLGNLQLEHEVLDTYSVRKDIRAIAPVMQLLFQSGEFDELLRWGKEAVTDFPEQHLPFEVSDLDVFREKNENYLERQPPQNETANTPTKRSKTDLEPFDEGKHRSNDSRNTPQETSSSNDLGGGLKTGKVQVYFAQDRAAYISGDDGLEYYLPILSIVNVKLRSSIESGVLGQEVYFTVNVSQQDRKRPVANNVFPLNEDTLEVIRSKVTPAESSKKSQANRAPKTSYRKAKDAHLTGDFKKAENLFQTAISEEPDNRPSALKDLAQLLDQMNRTSDAVSLLEKNTSIFSVSDEVPVLNLLAGYFTKLEDFVEAAKIYEKLYTLQDKIPKRKLVAAKQAAYCLFQIGQVNEALKFLTDVAQYSDPTDTFYLSLKEQLEEAVETGVTTVPDELIVSFSRQTNGNETGPIMRQAIDSCTFDMVDERSRDRGFYGEDDIRALSFTAKRSRGERPALRAQFELNLAAIFDSEASLFDEEGFRNSTFNFLTFSAEAAYVLHRLDSVISYLIEASQSIAVQTKTKAQKVIKMGLAVCVEPKIEVTEFFKAAAGRSLFDEKEVIMRVLAEKKRPYLDYFIAIVASSAAIRQALDNIDLSGSALKTIDTHISKYKENNERNYARLSELLQLSRRVDASEVKTLLQKLDQLDGLPLETDRNRVRQISTLLIDAAQYFDNDEYTEKELNVRTLSAKVDRILAECKREPTHVSALFLEPIAVNVLKELDGKFLIFSETVTTTVEVSDLFSDGYYVVNANGLTDFKFLISTSKGSAPLTDLTLGFEDESDFKVVDAVIPKNLRGGETREAVITVRIDPKTVEEGVVSVFGHLSYTERNTGSEIKHEFSLSVSLSPSDDFVEIDNVYEKYGTGSPVDEPEMFFGRAELVDRIERSIRHRTGGQCFVLYGQKRTGKTSVLYRLQETLKDHFLPVYLSVGQVDQPEEMNRSISTLIFYEIVRTVREFGIDVDYSETGSSDDLPFTIRLRKFAKHLDEEFVKKGEKSRTIVLLIDEFSYIYDAIKVGHTSPTFMRNWKNIVESKIVNAVIVGQDSMPRFIAEFANEFGVSDKERISYLSETASHELCSDPILLNGVSRYKGESLGRVYEITNGAAFFLQKFCFELVEFLNQRRRAYISQADVDHVFRLLVEGHSALQEADFDPLLQEASNATSVFGRDENMAVLRQIAARSDENRGANLEGAELPANWKNVLEDLQERDVVFSQANSTYSIKMELFAEWLRVNRPI